MTDESSVRIPPSRRAVRRGSFCTNLQPPLHGNSPQPEQWSQLLSLASSNEMKATRAVVKFLRVPSVLEGMKVEVFALYSEKLVGEVSG
ncbi:unnamed protein product [Protopolystoma xenopodis]|uniref:Uncharacterized protein n=1 Tax=Protopolystoma xenopodis TaxID=117903 RepID=A0A3S5BQS0_9PLAT|nr:unnamed protein product [Protopolystoma xenopodis]